MAANSIRVLENPYRCMQRLGFLKYVMVRCSQAPTSDLSSIGHDLLRAVAKKLPVAVDPHIAEYARRALTDRVYRGLRETIGRSGPEASVPLELQDAYLASPDMESRRGKLVAGDWRKYPYLALGLGLLRKGTYSLMVRGQVFLALTSAEEREAFKSYSRKNPLVLDAAQRLLLLFTLLEHDADVLIPLHKRLVKGGSSFSDRDAGDLLPDVIRETQKRLRPKIRTGDDIARLQRLLDTAKTIEQWRGRTYTGKGAREHNVTVRLEPLVDVGVLKKADPFAYRYEFSAAGEKLMSTATSVEDPQDFLDEHFFSESNVAFKIGATKMSDARRVLASLVEAFNSLKSPLEYAPIREVILLAATSALAGGRAYFDVSQGVEVLKSFQRDRPDAVRFNVDRWGNLMFVKFIKNRLG